MNGRFLHLLDAADQARMAEVYAGLPTVDGAGVAVQLSFPSLRTCADHVTLIAMPITLLRPDRVVGVRLLLVVLPHV